MLFPDPASPMPPGTRASVPKRVRAALLLAAAAGALGACTRPDAFAPACPQLGLLPDGASLTRFAGSGHDITDLVVDGRITAIPATCHWADDRHRKVEAKLQVAFSLNRGPAMRGRTVVVPYFVAVSENGTIYDKQVYALQAGFPPNTDRLGVTSPEISMLFPVSPEKSAVAYKITVSFQLTPEDLSFNRAHGPH